MNRAHGVSSVSLQLKLARQAFHRGGIEAARRALVALHASDFAGGAAVSAGSLAVLRDRHAGQEQVRAAVVTLLELRAAGHR